MLKRVIVIVAVVAAVIVAGALWLVARSHHSTYATPEEAVLETCHADPANPPHDYADRARGGPRPYRSTLSGPTLAIVGWTESGEPAGQAETALVLRAADGKWWVTNCRIDFGVRLNT
ncbi:MAG: hypothetical protein QOI15_1625 [Pseudonocardiales bacterium]|nr:hypothetical protein [Pseudonocardiales bacterium]